ncbi:hypothetical protein L9F63_002486, partial [Diploptera punctata]
CNSEAIMSRDEVNIRQHRSRLLQLAESTSSGSKSGGKRRGYSNAQLLRSNGGPKYDASCFRSWCGRIQVILRTSNTSCSRIAGTAEVAPRVQWSRPSRQPRLLKQVLTPRTSRIPNLLAQGSRKCLLLVDIRITPTEVEVSTPRLPSHRHPPSPSRVSPGNPSEVMAVAVAEWAEVISLPARDLDGGRAKNRSYNHPRQDSRRVQVLAPTAAKLGAPLIKLRNSNPSLLNIEVIYHRRRSLRTWPPQ